MTKDAAASPIRLDEQQVRDVLRQVVDPEVGQHRRPRPGLSHRHRARRVVIEMTMTSPACPMGEMITDDVKDVLAAPCRPAARPISSWSGNRPGSNR
jgi:metal-sulfur cluster biosynthetic enzyme